MDRRHKVVTEVNRRLAMRRPASLEGLLNQPANVVAGDLAAVLSLVSLRLEDAARSGPNALEHVLAMRNEMQRITSQMTGCMI